MVDIALMLFGHEPELVRRAAAGGVDRVVVDIETRGKLERQSGYHLEINRNRIEDLAPLRDLPLQRVLRINVLHGGTRNEIDRGIACGADWLMLPMVRYPHEVRRFVSLVGRRAKTIALIETLPGLLNLHDISRIPGLDEVYVGLNDLRLEAGWDFGYRFLSEGLLDFHLQACPIPFGLGGITVLDRGHPLATEGILRELARLGATRVIVRRAFKRDLAGLDIAEEVQRIKSFYRRCRRRTPAETEADRAAIWTRVGEICRTLQGSRDTGHE